MSEQYFANNRKVGDGVTTVWDFSFAGARPDAEDGTKSYLEQSDIRVALVDFDEFGLETRTEITFELIGPSQVRVEPSVPSGQDFVIYRKTPSDFVISDFVDFASVSERDLDDAFRQGLFAVQELRDESADTRRIADDARRDTAAALDIVSEITGEEEPLLDLVRKADLEAGLGEVREDLEAELGTVRDDLDGLETELGGVRDDLTDPDKGAAMMARGVVAVDSIADLLTLPESARREDLRYLVRGFYSGQSTGGGEFIWDGGQVKSDADGGSIIDPDTTGGFNGTPATSAAFLNAQGTGTGSGCWVRVDATSLGLPQTAYGSTGNEGLPAKKLSLLDAPQGASFGGIENISKKRIIAVLPRTSDLANSHMTQLGASSYIAQSFSMDLDTNEIWQCLSFYPTSPETIAIQVWDVDSATPKAIFSLEGAETIGATEYLEVRYEQGKRRLYIRDESNSNMLSFYDVTDLPTSGTTLSREGTTSVPTMSNNCCYRNGVWYTRGLFNGSRNPIYSFAEDTGEPLGVTFIDKAEDTYDRNSYLGERYAKSQGMAVFGSYLFLPIGRSLSRSNYLASDTRSKMANKYGVKVFTLSGLKVMESCWTGGALFELFPDEDYLEAEGIYVSPEGRVVVQYVMSDRVIFLEEFPAGSEGLVDFSPHLVGQITPQNKLMDVEMQDNRGAIRHPYTGEVLDTELDILLAMRDLRVHNVEIAPQTGAEPLRLEDDSRCDASRLSGTADIPRTFGGIITLTTTNFHTCYIERRFGNSRGTETLQLNGLGAANSLHNKAAYVRSSGTGTMDNVTGTIVQLSKADFDRIMAAVVSVESS